MKKLIYVCSPYSGDIEYNVEFARKASRFVVDQGHIPITPHLFLPQFISEETERELAMEINTELLEICDELWFFGDKISMGMEYEIRFAKDYGTPTINYTGLDLYDRYVLTPKADDLLDKLEDDLVKVIPNYESKKVIRHREICEGLTETYKSKNADYGDSFGISYAKYGKISALTRLSDKFNRIENILLGHETSVSGETVIDTLTDLANYAIMTRMELEIDKKEGEKYCEEID